MRTLLVSLHVIAAVSWLSQVVTLLVLVILSATSSGGLKVEAAEMAHRLDFTVLVASAITAATSGLGLAAVTSWGFFQRWWISTKVALTTAQILIGTGIVAGGLTQIEAAGREGHDGPVLPTAVALVLIAAGLTFQVWVSLAKPWGRTPYGRRSRPQPTTAPTAVIAAMVLAPLLDIGWLALLGFPLPVLALTTIGLALALRRRRQLQESGSAADQPSMLVIPGRITARRDLAEDVVALRVRPCDATTATAWEPGAHIDVHLPSGRIRQYSLCGRAEPGAEDQGDQGYDLAVLRNPEGRGGSLELHDLPEGTEIGLGQPRNHFPLVEADSYLFIAGGIGITPLVRMIAQLADAGASWRLIYRGSALSSMAFAQDLADQWPEHVDLYPADTTARPDLTRILSEQPPGVAVYCCGPTGLLDAVTDLMPTSCPDGALHVEHFTAPAQNHDRDQPMRVVLARPGTILEVPADRSILESMRHAQVEVPASCEAGFCGTCRLGVLDGRPDHRDQILQGDDRERRDVIYPCVSRAQDDLLVLDA